MPVVTALALTVVTEIRMVTRVPVEQVVISMVPMVNSYGSPEDFAKFQDSSKHKQNHYKGLVSIKYTIILSNKVELLIANKSNAY